MRSDRGVRFSGITPPNVTKWENQIKDYSADGTQGTGGSQPVLQTGVNGLPCLRFSAGQVLAWTAGYFSAATIALVVKMNSEPHTGFSMFVMTDGASFKEFILDLATYSYVSFVDAAVGQMVGHNDTLGTSLPHAMIHTYDGTNYTAILDGAPKTVVTSGAYGGVGTSAIGARSGLTFPSDADFYEIIAYNRVLTSLEQNRLADYLKQRYST